MSRGHHPLVTDEGAAAEVVASVQGHLVGDGILRAGVAPDDLVIVVRGESHLSGNRGGEADTAGGWSPEPRGWTLLIRIPDRAQGGEATWLVSQRVALPSRCVSAGRRDRQPAGAAAQTSTGTTRARTVNPLIIGGSECGPPTHWLLLSFLFITSLLPTAVSAPVCHDGLASVGRCGCKALALLYQLLP